MQGCPVKLVEAGERDSIGDKREDTLVLCHGSSVVEGRATILVMSIDIGESNHVQDHIKHSMLLQQREQRGFFVVCAKDKCVHLTSKVSVYTILMNKLLPAFRYLNTCRIITTLY